MDSLPIRERDDFDPVCPYCEARLKELIARTLASSFLSKRTAYCCPECQKVLGIAHRKGLLAN